MEGVIARSKSSRQKDDASKSNSHKSGSKNSVTLGCKRSETSSVLKARAGPDGRCFHAAWAVSKSVH